MDGIVIVRKSKQQTIDRLSAENAKLREMVAHLSALEKGLRSDISFEMDRAGREATRANWERDKANQFMELALRLESHFPKLEKHPFAVKDE